MTAYLLTKVPSLKILWIFGSTFYFNRIHRNCMHVWYVRSNQCLGNNKNIVNHTPPCARERESNMG